MAQRNSNTELRRALKASLRLQSHYATLLNQIDGGQRKVFAGLDEWLARLRELDARVRCNEELASARELEDRPAYLVAMAVNDWETEKRLIEGESLAVKGEFRGS